MQDLTSVVTITIATVLLASGCKEDGAQPKVIGPPNVTTCPDLAGWAGVTVRGGTASLVRFEGDVARDLIKVHSRINSLRVHQPSGQVAYAEEPNGRGLFLLRVRGRLDQPDKTLFTSQALIHSLCWSPGGKRLAFFVGGYISSTEWRQQQLYIASVGDESEPRLRDCGKTTIYSPHSLDADQMASQLVWSTDEGSLYWVDGEKRILRLGVESGERETLCSAERLFMVEANALVVARREPWRLVRVPGDGGPELLVADLEGLESVGVGTLVPNSPVLCVVVRERQPADYMKNPLMPTLFVNLESGVVCGRIAEPIVGFVRSDAVSVPPTPRGR